MMQKRTPLFWAVFIAISSSTSLIAYADEIDATWNGGVGDWNDSSLWTYDQGVPGFPNNGIDTFDVTIDGDPGVDSVVSIVGGSRTVDSIGIGAGDTLIITNNRSLTVRQDGGRPGSGAINNDGEIQLNSAGSFTGLNVSGDVSLNGSGTITLGDFAFNRIGGSGSLNNSGNTIQGAGNIGTNTLGIINQAGGVIVANGTNALTIDPSAAGGVVNQGMMRSDSGSTLILTGSGTGAFDNSGGTIMADGPGAVVSLTTSADITGGTLVSSGGGVIEAAVNQAVTLRGVELSGGSQYIGRNNTDTNLEGTITNNGNIALASIGNLTDIQIVGDVVLAGTGTVTLGDNNNNRIVADAFGDRLTVSADQVIQGTGQIGANTMSVTNDGLIVSDNPGSTLVIDPSNVGGLTNNGTLRADNDATLVLSGSGLGTFDNTNGVIEAVNGGVLTLIVGADITGGLLSSDASPSLIEIAASQAATLRDLELGSGSQFIARNNTDTNLVGTITNNGDIAVASAGSTTDIQIVGDVVLAGTGTVTLGDNVNNRIVANATGNRLTVSENQIIQGTGQIGANTMSVTNNGLIVSDNAGSSLFIDPSNVGGLTNNGTLRADNDATLVLSGSGLGTFDNTNGVIEAVNGGVLTLIAGVDISGGLITSDGSASLIEIAANQSATLRDLELGSGSQFIARNNTDTNLVGTITNNGDIAVASAGSSTDIQITGDVVLAGTGTVTLGDNINNRIIANATGNILTLSENQIIQGTGQIGANTMSVTNNGLIVSDNAGSSLFIDPSNAGGFTNNGTLRADNDATLVLSGSGLGTFDNTNGVIEAVNGGVLTLIAGVDITGGLLSSDASPSLIEIAAGQVATLRDLELGSGSQFIARNNTDTNLAGTITNNGDIALASTGSLTDIQISSDVVLDGTGTVTMGDRTANRIIATSAGARLTNSADHTIQGSGQIGANTMAVTNQGLIEANQPTDLVIDPPNVADAFINDTSGTLRASSGANLILTGSGLGFFDNRGLVEALDGSSVAYVGAGSTLNNQSGDLVGGFWRAEETGGGATITLQGDLITTNSADVTLSGANSVIQVGTTALDDTLHTNNGVLRLQNGRVFSAVANGGNFTNDGLIELSDSSFDSTSLTGSTGNIDSFGNSTVITGAGNQVAMGDGTISSSMGTLVISEGVDMTAGTMTSLNDGGGFDLSGAASASNIGTLNSNGSLDLGAQNIVIHNDYTNENFGEGNAFDARANVTGSGQIIGNNASQTITGDVGGADNSFTLDFGNVRGGESATLDFQVANDGTGAALRGAVQTAAGGGLIDDGRLSGSGVSAANFGPVAAGESTGALSVTFDAASGGSLAGQTIAIVNNFDNVATDIISLSGTATTLAAGSATPNADPVDLGNFRVGSGALTSQSFDVENTSAAGATTERLGISGVGTSGNFAGDNALGNGLIAGGDTSVGAVSVSVAGGVAGANNGSVSINYVTNGELIDSSFTSIAAGDETINLQATGYREAVASVETAAPVDAGFARVGDSNGFDIGIRNDVASDGFSEGLNAAVSSTSAAIDTISSGTFNDLQAQDVGTISGTVNAATAGINSGTVGIDFATEGATTSGLAAMDIGGTTVEVQIAGIDFAQPIVQASLDFGNVLQGSAQQNGIEIRNEILNDAAFQDSLNAQFADAGVPPSGIDQLIGEIIGLAPGAIDTSTMQIRLDTDSVGVVSATVTVELESDGTAFGLGVSPLDSQNVLVEASITGSVGSLANPVVTPGDIDFGEFHISAGSDSQGIDVSNDIVIGEGLEVSLGAVSGGFATADVLPATIAAAGTLADAVTVTIDTGTAGDKGGSVELDFVSDGSFNSGNPTTLASQVVNVTGAGYALAEGTVDAPTIDLGAVRVDDLAEAFIGVSNSGPDTGGFTEGLDATLTGLAGSAATASGAVSTLAQGASSTGDLLLAIDTGSSGAKLATATVDFQSNGAGLNSLGITDIGDGSVSVEVDVIDFAQPIVQASLDFGNVLQGSAQQNGIEIRNEILNDAAFQDSLNAQFADAGVPPSGIDQLIGEIIGLAPGAIDTSTMQIRLDTDSVGVVSATVTVELESDGTAFGLGVSPLDSQNVLVEASITGSVGSLANPVVTPGDIDFGEFHISAGSDSQGIDVSNDIVIGEGLEVSLGAVSGGFATADVLPATIAAAGTLADAVTVTIDTGTAGDKGGSVELDFVSDGSFNSGNPTTLASQVVNVTGAGYALAEGTVDAPTIDLGAVRVDDLAEAFIGVSNSGPDTGGFTEGLDATLTGLAGSAATASGAVSTLAQGASSTGDLLLAIDTGSSGAKLATATVDFQSNGAGLNSLGITDIGDGSVSVAVDVFQIAAAAIAGEDLGTPIEIDFGLARVTDGPLEITREISNIAAGALVDALVGEFAPAPDAPISTDLGTLASGVAAGDSATLTFGLDTSTAGTFSDTGMLELLSRNPELDDLLIDTADFVFSGTINDLASPVFEQVAGDGSFSGADRVFDLDFGSILESDDSLLSAELSLLNDVFGPADLLGGTFDLTGAGVFNLLGFDPFSDLAPGASQGGLFVSFDTSLLGTGSFTGFAEFNGISVFPGLDDVDLGNYTLNFRGRIVGDSVTVPTPGTVFLFLGPLLLVLYRRPFRKVRVG